MTLSKPLLLMDRGNAGTAVEEMFRHAGVGVIPVLIHGGYQTNYDRRDGIYRVPKGTSSRPPRSRYRTGAWRSRGAAPHRGVGGGAEELQGHGL